MSKMKIAIIGVGGNAQGHVQRLLASPDAEVVGLVDINPVRFTVTKEKFPVLADTPTYSNYKDLLAAGGLDAVVISTPHTLHFDMIMDSLEAGLHVLTEKPMVCTTPHAKTILAKVKETGKVLQVGYQRHFVPQFRYIKSAVENGELGDIMFISALQCQNWKKGQVGLWRQDPALSGGGQLNDSGSHLIDIILWTSGLTAASVHAFVDNCGTAVDINSALTMRFTNGAQGTISVVGDSVCGWYEDFTIWGAKGAFFYRNGQLTRCSEAGEMTPITEFPPAANVDQGFLDTVLGRDKNWVPGECGLRVIELTEAAWKSADKCAPCEVATL